MLLLRVLSCSLFLISSAFAAFEGEGCSKNGIEGKCVNIRNCPSAIADIRNKKNPQICAFDGTDPIVCCVDNLPTKPTPGPKPVATTSTSRTTTTEEYEPPTYDYSSNDNKDGDNKEKCEPISPTKTTPRTGQKAWDKCIEYQEKYVYPCAKTFSLTGELGRANNCNHNADELIIGGVNAAKSEFPHMAAPPQSIPKQNQSSNDDQPSSVGSIDNVLNVVGGEDVKYPEPEKGSEFPHMALLGFDGDSNTIAWLCGGSIISERFILTAGHCTSTKDYGKVAHVLIGILKRTEDRDSKRYKIQEIIKHPEYKPPSKFNDIALLKTETDMKLDQFAIPACLHINPVVNDAKAQATGWGAVEYRGANADIMQKVTLEKFTNRECSDHFPDNRLMKGGYNMSTQMCYGDKYKSKDTCQGDSGGPLQVKTKKIDCMYTVIGITSFGKACGFVGDPGLYTRVEFYTPWIENIVWP